LSEFFRAGAVGATLLIAAMTVASPAAADLSLGQVCWPETPLLGLQWPGVQRRGAPAGPRAAQAAAPGAAEKSCRGERTASDGAANLSRPTVSPSEPRVYRYPTMYRAEAPPLLPPGARRFPPYAQQPYVLVAQGIWYWPGATDFKMPQVPGFEPLIDPSRVISWSLRAGDALWRLRSCGRARARRDRASDA
jgi:hypothetical protein